MSAVETRPAKPVEVEAAIMSREVVDNLNNFVGGIACSFRADFVREGFGEDNLHELAHDGFLEAVWDKYGVDVAQAVGGVTLTGDVEVLAIHLSTDEDSAPYHTTYHASRSR